MVAGGAAVTSAAADSAATSVVVSVVVAGISAVVAHQVETVVDREAIKWPHISKATNARREANTMEDRTLELTLNELTAQITHTYGESLLAVILYGSAASDEFVEGRSNINCLVLLKQVTPDELKKSSPLLQNWHEQGIRTPLFVDPAYVRSAIDVFPIEFLDMKQRYRVLYGQDFLRDLDVKLDHLRFQCEQELKGKNVATAPALSGNFAIGVTTDDAARQIG